MVIGSDFCCICGRQGRAYNNPDPIREGARDCCNACNLLVRAARERLFSMTEEETSAYIARLREMSYSELRMELLPDVCP